MKNIVVVLCGLISVVLSMIENINGHQLGRMMELCYHKVVVEGKDEFLLSIQDQQRPGAASLKHLGFNATVAQQLSTDVVTILVDSVQFLFDPKIFAETERIVTRFRNLSVGIEKNESTHLIRRLVSEFVTTESVIGHANGTKTSARLRQVVDVVAAVETIVFEIENGRQLTDNRFERDAAEAQDEARTERRRRFKEWRSWEKEERLGRKDDNTDHSDDDTDYDSDSDTDFTRWETGRNYEPAIEQVNLMFGIAKMDAALRNFVTILNEKLGNGTIVISKMELRNVFEALLDIVDRAAQMEGPNDVGLLTNAARRVLSGDNMTTAEPSASTVRTDSACVRSSVADSASVRSSVVTMCVVVGMAIMQ